MDNEMITMIVSTISVNLCTVIGVVASITKVVKAVRGSNRKRIEQQEKTNQELREMLTIQQREIGVLMENLRIEQMKRLNIYEEKIKQDNEAR